MHEKIRELRQRKGLTMKELADAVGTSQQQVDRLEKGHRRITLDWLERLSNALDCSVIDMLPPSCHRLDGVRTARAKVVGEVGENGVICWWPEDERYTILFGRPCQLANPRLFALRVDISGIGTGFPPGTELVFSEVSAKDVEEDDSIREGWVVSFKGRAASNTSYRMNKCAPDTPARQVRARLVKSLRNE